MAFTIVQKDSPDKVEGQLNKKSPRDKALEAFMGKQGAQAAPEVPAQAPAVDPAAQAASNSPAASGQISAEAFNAIRQQHKAEIDNESPQTANTESQAPGTPQVSPPEATKPTEGEQPLSPRYAQLARQEKALRAQRQAFAAEKAEIQKQKDALAARETELQNQYVSKERLRKDALTVLQESGIDYNTLSEQALNSPDPKDQVIEALKAEIADIRGSVEKTNKSIEDGNTQSYNQAKSMIRQDISRLVSKDPNFEMIKATESVDDVVELIEKTFQEGLDENFPKGTLLSVEEASQMVEDYLSEEGERLARLSKIQKRLLPKQDSPPTKSPQTQQHQPKPTLTNGMTGAPKKEYTQRQRAVFAAQYGPNWQEKVGDKAS